MKTPIILTIALALTLFACKKEETLQTINEPSNPENCAKPIPSQTKGDGFELTFRVGHKAQGCPGCTMVFGVLVHKECKGAGTECLITVFCTLSKSENDSTFVAIIQNPNQLTYDDDFEMPARSLYVQGTNGQFLNIPAQTAYRDDKTGTFTFYDLFYSDRQVFENR